VLIAIVSFSCSNKQGDISTAPQIVMNQIDYTVASAVSLTPYASLSSATP
jgi:hypothetical protein